ncbi:HNH endonuclease [Streptomyces sp. NBC_01590]|uniref:HNH endonuclease n=1 Tax=Streptomyces sp. NBC_01590 TaxID=2975887 RepID=UPI003869EEDA
MTQAIRPAFINCVRCGAQKRVGRSGPIPTYCSANCRAALKYERSQLDGRYEQSLAEFRQRTVERREAAARPCPYCDEAMPNPRRKQCGKPDCKRAFNADRMRDWHHNYQAERGQRYTTDRMNEGQRAYGKRRREEQVHWRQRYPEVAAAHDARRRMRLEQARTAEVFAPVDVHTRDEWTCQLCRRPIDHQVAWPDPMSASVDHVVPLSKGGLHSLINVQSAHLGCNSSKGDRVAGEAEAVL